MKLLKRKIVQEHHLHYVSERSVHQFQIQGKLIFYKVDKFPYVQYVGFAKQIKSFNFNN